MCCTEYRLAFPANKNFREKTAKFLRFLAKFSHLQDAKFLAKRFTLFAGNPSTDPYRETQLSLVQRHF